MASGNDSGTTNSKAHGCAGVEDVGVSGAEPHLLKYRF